jgi:site-specific DNA recombinase
VKYNPTVHQKAIAMNDDIIQNLGYARVSTSEQANSKHGLETQLNRLKKAGCTEIYQDVASGRSWGDAKREDFSRICDLVKNRKVKQITVTALDRLSRESTTSAKFLQTLEETGVLIYELDSDRYINFIDPNEWYESRQKGLQAEYESRKTSMRVRAGYQNLRDLHKANPRTPYGYKRVNQEYVLNPDEAAIAREAIALYLELKTLPPVTRLIYEKYGKRFSVSGLRQWLLNPVLIGNTPYDKRNPKPAHLPQGNQIIYGTHVDQALMTEAEQRAIAEILTENTRIWGKNRKAFQNPLSGLVFCGECGVSCDLMSKPSGGIKTEFRRIRSFYCRTRSKKPAGKSCSQRGTYKIEIVEAIAIQALTEKAGAIATIYEADDDKVENPKIKELRGQITVLESMKNPMLSEAIAKLQDEITNLERSHDVDQGINQELRSLLIEAFSDPDFFATLDNEEKRSLYKSLISKIVVCDRKVVSVELKI